MNTQQQSLQDIKQIKKMMERSSRFISLSGLSGISAGICALAGAWFANDVINQNGNTTGYRNSITKTLETLTIKDFLSHRLIQIAITTFIAAVFFAFLFTFLRSSKNKIPLWGYTSKRLLINVAVPMLVGGIYLFRQVQLGHYELIAPGCLIFYGLALVNSSKYTLTEIKYLGYCQIVLGIINCWFISDGLKFWTLGFGMLHIIYGIVMWYRYERK